MTELILIRHGQANAEATDEEGYDRLSGLGYDQARWLGEWIRGAGIGCDRVVRGSLRRHRETAEGLALGREAEVDPRWNEISYFILSTLYAEHHGRTEPFETDDFADYFSGLMQTWSVDALPGAPERWTDFRDRVTAAMAAEAERGGRAIVVTSGGVIGLAVATALELGPDGMARLGVAIENTSVHRLVWRGGRWRLLEFGSVPHLMTAERETARTYV